jgi:hypothetical protein
MDLRGSAIIGVHATRLTHPTNNNDLLNSSHALYDILGTCELEAKSKRRLSSVSSIFYIPIFSLSLEIWLDARQMFDAAIHYKVGRLSTHHKRANHTDDYLLSVGAGHISINAVLYRTICCEVVCLIADGFSEVHLYYYAPMARPT